MTSKDIEEGAILALKKYIQGSDVISQHISDNDKEPFWDGHLYLYAKDDKAKNSFIGRVPVQLKGKEMKTFNPHCSHPLCNSLISNIRIF